MFEKTYYILIFRTLSMSIVHNTVYIFIFPSTYSFCLRKFGYKLAYGEIDTLAKMDYNDHIQYIGESCLLNKLRCMDSCEKVFIIKSSASMETSIIGFTLRRIRKQLKIQKN